MLGRGGSFPARTTAQTLHIKVSLFLLFFFRPFIAVFTPTRSQATSSASSRAELSTTPCPPPHAGCKQVKVGDKTPPEQPDPKFPSLLFPPAPPVPPHPRGWNIPLCPSSSALGVSPPPRRYQQGGEKKKKKNPSAAMQSQDFSPPIPRGKIRGHIPLQPTFPTASRRDPCADATGNSWGAKRGDTGTPRSPPSPPEPCPSPQGWRWKSRRAAMAAPLIPSAPSPRLRLPRACHRRGRGGGDFFIYFPPPKINK